MRLVPDLFLVFGKALCKVKVSGQHLTGAVARRCSVKKLFLKIWQNSHDNVRGL